MTRRVGAARDAWLLPVLLPALLLSLAGRAAAQEPVLRPGDRIRVESDEVVHFRVRGEVVELRPDGVVLRARGESPERFLSADFISRIEREAGRRRATLDGALLGAAAGLLVGVGIVGAAEADDRIDPACGRSHCYGRGIYAATTAAGAVAGALVGSRFRVTIWERVWPWGD